MKTKHSERLLILGEGVYYENVTKAKTKSAARVLMAIAPFIEELENAALSASSELFKMAGEIRRSHTVGDEWDGTEPEAYTECMRLTELADALVSATTSDL